MKRGNNPVMTNYDETGVEPLKDLVIIPNVDNGFVDDDDKKKDLTYNNLKIGAFEEEISGINLSKLFSVYGA